MIREQFMLTTDKYICSILNFKQRFIDAFDFCNNKLIKRNRILKNSSKSDMCFILGNGMSLNDVDLTKIANYPIFVVNYFFKGDKRIDPAFLVFIDNAVLTTGASYIIEQIKKHTSTRFILPTDFFKTKYYNELSEGEKNRIYFVKDKLKTYFDYIQIDMTKDMTVSKNVIPFTIQCALYIGFKKIHLLGYDFTLYSQYKCGHFYDCVNELYGVCDVTENLISGAITQRHNFAIANYCKCNNIVVKNLNIKSFVKAFEFADYDELF